MNNNSIIISDNLAGNKTEYLIIFRKGVNIYGINIKNILEIINIPLIETPMIMPKGIIGFCNYNGAMIKIIDINPFLGFSTDNFSVNDKLIIVNVQDNCFAVHTEEIINIIPLAEENVQILPVENKNAILREIYNSQEHSINIIDIQILNDITLNNTEKNTINYSELMPKDEESKKTLRLRTENNILNNDNYTSLINLPVTNQFLLFTLDNNNYYLDLKYIKEFVSYNRVNITKLPYTKNFIKGIINSKGDFVVVIDLKCFLNKEESIIKDSSKLIITEGRNFNIAFLVDDIKYIKSLNNIKKDERYTGNSKYIISEFTEDNELYSILSYEKILSDERIYIDIN